MGRFAEGNAGAERNMDTARFRWRPSCPTVVLMYHRVERRDCDPLRLCVTPENFAAQVAVICSFAEIVAPAAIFGPGDGPRVALTFDDGYADNLIHAAPVLQRYQAPACVFATNRYLPDDPEFWWDQLEHLFLEGDTGVAFVELDFVTGRVRFDVRSSAGRIRTFARLNVVFRDLADDVRQAHIDDLHGQLGRSPVVCAGHRRLRSAELRTLSEGGLVEIGGHTVSHAALPLIDDMTATSEIADNRTELAALTGHPPRLFAYPYGSYRRRHVSQVRSAGYSMAFLARADPIGQFTNPLTVPRLPMKDWTAEEFRPALIGALAGR